MNFEKYKNLLLTKIKDQIFQWSEIEEYIDIPNAEVYRFLHSIKGTSGTLQLEDIYQISNALIEQMKSLHKEQWNSTELVQFLFELKKLSLGCVSINNKETKRQFESEHKPLIQIIDDDISILILLKDYLEKQGWMVITNSNSVKAVSQFFELHPDCVLIDVNLPEKNGFEIIEDIQIHSNKLFVPIIMISVLNDRNTRMKAYKMGADDFIEKPIDLEELSVHIERHLQRKQIYDQSVLLDELTNLYNRRYLKVVFDRCIDELNRFHHPFSIAILDIDHFKRINDKYGHLTGDTVLSKFASYLKENTRSSDVVFRYGGEEFIILFPNTDDSQAQKIISRFLDKISSIHFDGDSEEFYVTFSAGINTILSDKTTMEEALAFADQALYKAKKMGRARVECFHPSFRNMDKKKLFISIIDDDSIIRSMLKRKLEEIKIEEYEINIECFQNGPEFFQSNNLEKNGKHFLILDGVMPMMDGLEVLKRVKQTEWKNEVSVIMLTGRNSKKDIARALELGADDYMTKPFNVADLKARISQLIHRKK